MAGEGKLERKARWIASSRYGQIHNTAARADQARRYARRLGLTGLGAGLRPLGD